MLKAWKEMEEKASQCAQVWHIKEASSSLWRRSWLELCVCATALYLQCVSCSACWEWEYHCTCIKKETVPGWFESSDLNKTNTDVTGLSCLYRKVDYRDMLFIAQKKWFCYRQESSWFDLLHVKISIAKAENNANHLLYSDVKIAVFHLGVQT